MRGVGCSWVEGGWGSGVQADEGGMRGVGCSWVRGGWEEWDEGG